MTTLGSAKVLVSPRSLTSPAAIFLRMRRMIFPDLVFGSTCVKWMTSGVAIGPIIVLTHILCSCLSSSEALIPCSRVT